MNLRRLSPALLVLALPLGCSLVQQVAASGVQTPTLAFKEAHLSEISLAGATVDLVFTIQNPNSEGISLAETDYLLQVEGRQLVAGKPAGGIQIPARGTTDVILPANVKFADLAASISALLSQHSVGYQASGHIGVNTPIGVATLPFEHQGRLDLPLVPSVSVGSPKVTNISLGAATLEVPLTVTNANAYPLPLGVLAGSLNIAGNDVGTVQTPEVGMLAASASQVVMLPVRIRFLDALAAADALRKGAAHVALKGELRAVGVAIPFQIEGDVNLVRDSSTGSGGN